MNETIILSEVKAICEGFIEALETGEFGSSYKEERAKISAFNEILDLMKTK